MIASWALRSGVQTILPAHLPPYFNKIIAKLFTQNNIERAKFRSLFCYYIFIFKHIPLCIYFTYLLHSWKIWSNMSTFHEFLTLHLYSFQPLDLGILINHALNTLMDKLEGFWLEIYFGMKLKSRKHNYDRAPIKYIYSDKLACLSWVKK